MRQNGELITRDSLRAACVSLGITVQSSIRSDTHLLVASRRDTVKAKHAQTQGIEVLSYPSFFNIFMRDIKIPAGGAYNPFTDKISNLDDDLPLPAFVSGEKLAEVDIL